MKFRQDFRSLGGFGFEDLRAKVKDSQCNKRHRGRGFRGQRVLAGLLGHRRGVSSVIPS